MFFSAFSRVFSENWCLRVRAVCVKGAFEDAHRLRLWQAAGGSVLTYGDSMLFLKCVTDRGGSGRTKTILGFSITLFETLHGRFVGKVQNAKLSGVCFQKSFPFY